LEEDIVQLEKIRADLNYEMLLGRAVDRVLHHRAIDDIHRFITSVESLEMALVDLPGKPLRREIDGFIENLRCYPDGGFSKVALVDARSVFKEITRMLAIRCCFGLRLLR